VELNVREFITFRGSFFNCTIFTEPRIILLKLFPAYLKIIFLNNKVPYVHSVTIIIRDEIPPAKSGL